ncbi:MAG: hypothetical protein J0H01_14225 [Rhizobiales bacterium]|nr:hypothetical protein [Hyphomicrobiales bacterium]
MPHLKILSLLAALAVLPAGAALGDALVIPPANYPPLASQAAAPEGFVPPGWRLEQSRRGDLTGDGIEDVAFVLRQVEPANILANPGLGARRFDTNPRILVVAFGRADHSGFDLALRNTTLIPRRENPTLEDPLANDAIAIASGALRIRLRLASSAGSWETASTTYTFQHRDGELRMVGYDRSTTMRNTGETKAISINYLTGRVKRTTGRIESDEVATRWSALRNRSLPTIESIGDGLAFEPAV